MDATDTIAAKTVAGSPFSSTGVSMMASSPPGAHYVQAGFHVGSPEAALLSRDPTGLVAEATQRRASVSTHAWSDHQRFHSLGRYSRSR